VSQFSFCGIVEDRRGLKRSTNRWRPHCLWWTPDQVRLDHATRAIPWHIADMPVMDADPDSLVSGEVISPPHGQSGGSLKQSAPWMHTYHPLTLQAHESTDRQPDHQRDASLDFSASSADVSAPQTQPPSAPGEASAAPDILTTLHAFSRLPPEQRRALLPVLNTITATPRMSEDLTSDAGDVVAPPSYHG
jgi:hypothetical protein